MLAGHSSSKLVLYSSLSAVLTVLLAACGDEQASQTVTEPAASSAATMPAEASIVEREAAPTPRPPSQQQGVERERNKQVVASFIEVLGDSAAEQVFLAADYQMIRGEFHNLSYNAGGSELEDAPDPAHVAISGRRNELVELIGEGRTVVAQYQITGTHQGNLFGIPATGKPIDVEAVAILELADGKIEDGWYMADEVSLLNQLGTIMPARADGKLIVPPTNVATRSGDELLAEALADPIDSQEYRNKLKVNAYKAPNAPAGMYAVKPNNGPYNTYLRARFLHLADFAMEPAKSEFPMGAPSRIVRI